MEGKSLLALLKQALAGEKLKVVFSDGPMTEQALGVLRFLRKTRGKDVQMGDEQYLDVLKLTNSGRWESDQEHTVTFTVGCMFDSEVFARLAANGVEEVLRV